MIDLTPLLPLCDKAAARRAMSALPPSEKPDHMVIGRLGAVSFVVTLDGDGECEASLCADIGKPSEATIRAFFDKWGQPVPTTRPTVISGGHGLHWVVSRGVRH